MTYLDHNATSPLAKGLFAFIQPYFEAEFGNPSSLAYELGRNAKAVVENAREEVAKLVDADPDQVVFTSGGTESISLAILGMGSTMNLGDTILRSSVEHSAVKESIEFCQSVFAIKEKLIPVSKNGDLVLDVLSTISDVKLVSVMLANNETGIIHDLKSLRNRIPAETVLHVDATQGVGKIPFSFKEMEIDLCSFSAHKFGGPKGIGALIVKNGNPWRSPMSGGGQEKGRRGGTENVALIAGMGFAASRAREKLNADYIESLTTLRNYFEKILKERIPEVEIVGEKSPRLPNTSNSLIPGIVGANLVKYLGDKGICISAGSACKTSTLNPSPVLTAMGFSSMSSVSGIRVSFGEGNVTADADLLVEEIVKFCKENNKIEELIS